MCIYPAAFTDLAVVTDNGKVQNQGMRSYYDIRANHCKFGDYAALPDFHILAYTGSFTDYSLEHRTLVFHFPAYSQFGLGISERANEHIIFLYLVIID